jgi:hypothetical protein
MSMKILIATLILTAGTTSAHAETIIPSIASRTVAFTMTALAIDTPRVDSAYVDSMFHVWSNDDGRDSIDVDWKHGGFRHRKHRPHIFVLTELERAREVPYAEKFSMLDFNRVTGFFLGLGTPGFADIGNHDELGITGGTGYGFADKRWEYRVGTEFRLPLVSVRTLESDTGLRHSIYTPHTLAIGAEFHNITATGDAWRAGRLENAGYAFFAREDFRDYFKLAGWNAYIAYRPIRNYEARIEWRSDHYQALSQEVFYGRWGGNKVLPPNPPVWEGRMNSLVISSQHEMVHTRYLEVANAFGDKVPIEQLTGMSSLFQIEFGHMPGSDFGFNRYLLDMRHFVPLFPGLSFDSRFRFEATTGDMLPQKIEYVGGPSSLPALYRKDIAGNRMLLLNTEIRQNLEMLSSVFHMPDLSLIIYNDFAKIGIAGDGESIFKGFQFSGASSILYNVGVGLGWTNGLQFGVTWPTNAKDDPRIIFRLQRAF